MGRLVPFRGQLRPQVLYEPRVEKELPDRNSLFRLHRDCQRQVLRGSQQSYIDAVQLVVEPNIRDSLQIDDTIADSNKRMAHGAEGLTSLADGRRTIIDASS